MGSMVPAVGIEAVFEGKQKDGKTYTFSRPVLFWYATEEGNLPVGMYLDDTGQLMGAPSRSNFTGYTKTDKAPVVGAVPGGDLYAVYRQDGQLNRSDIPVIVVTADGELLAREFDSDGTSYMDPSDSSNFVGYWRKSWGDEPAEWQPKQGTFFEASGGSPPMDEA